MVESINRHVPLSASRRLACDAMHFSQKVPLVVLERRMRLAELVQNRITLAFEYWRGEELVARGEQQVACMTHEAGRLVPAPVPPSLREALAAYSD